MTIKSAVINKIVKKYGGTIDIENHPEVLEEIIRQIGPIADDGGVCGGTPPSPAPPPSGGKRAIEIANADLMKVLLNLAREVSEIKQQVGSLSRK